MIASFKKHTLNFKLPAGTSRGVLKTKDTYILTLFENNQKGIGECALFKGLSFDDVPNYEEMLQWTCNNINLGEKKLLHTLTQFPSIQFGVEQAFLSLKNNNPHLFFQSSFTSGKTSIPINGLVWMGDLDFMKQQIKEKINAGFTTLKLKIGALNFDEEYNLLKKIRATYNSNDIELRVDANGAFNPNEVLQKLELLSKLKLHSIEQPIKAGQWKAMAQLCKTTPLPIALDEELIGVFNIETKKKLLKNIKPQYLIFKPSLIGGFQGTQEWIDLAAKHNIDWWITSALESNIGLNAIAQFTYNLNTNIPQGLGTGGLFTNNFKSSLFVENGQLYCNTNLTLKCRVNSCPFSATLGKKYFHS